MKKILSGIFSALFFSMTFLSCGLDTFYTVPAPYQSGKGTLSIENNDPNNNTVSFITNEIGLASDFSFDGTSVYYKIFSSKDACINSYVKIDSVNNDSNYSAASDKVRNEYSQLKYISSSGDVEYFVVLPSGSNSSVEIRLTDYYTPDTQNPDTRNISYIKINSSISYSPARTECTTANKKIFNFGWQKHSGYTESCELPSSSWSSKEFSGGTSTDGWYYIDLYTLAYGHDTTWTQYYSKPFHLGVIKVKADSEMNY